MLLHEGLLIIFIWECLRLAARKMWEMSKEDDTPEECPRCGAKVHDLYFHEQRCPSRFKHATYIGRHREY